MGWLLSSRVDRAPRSCDAARMLGSTMPRMLEEEEAAVVVLVFLEQRTPCLIILSRSAACGCEGAAGGRGSSEGATTKCS